MRTPPKTVGLAIVGAGRVGLIRGAVAVRHPEVEGIGIAEAKADRATAVAEKMGADFVPSDFRELHARPELNAAIISTDEHLHVRPAHRQPGRDLPHGDLRHAPP